MKALRPILLCLLLAAGTAVSAAIPADALLDKLQPDGFVNDFANVLSPADRAALEQRVRALQDKTGAELAVVTIQSLAGGDVDDFTNKLFARWGIGQKGKNNGVMLLVAMQDRKMRIEVGYGLEPIIPDALAGRILDEELRPRFRQQQYAAGLKQGVERLAERIERGQPASWRDKVKLPTRAFKSTGQLIGITAFLSLFVALGWFIAGAGMGARVSFLILWGVIFGGIPLFMGFAAGGTPLLVHGPLAVVMWFLGFRTGRRNPGSFRSAGGRRTRGYTTGGWVWGASSGGGGWSSGGFSSGGGGGFGGGCSGGGGASGGW